MKPIAPEQKPWYHQVALFGIVGLCARSYIYDKVPTVATAVLFGGSSFCIPTYFMPKLTGKKMALLTAAGLGAAHLMLPASAAGVASGVVSSLIARTVLSDLQRALIGFG